METNSKYNLCNKYNLKESSEQLQMKRHRVPRLSTLVLTPESETGSKTKDQNDVRDTAYAGDEPKVLKQF